MPQPSVDQCLSRAKTAARRGDVEGALALYDAVLTRFPQNRRALQGRATLANPALKDGGNGDVERLGREVEARVAAGDGEGAVKFAAALAAAHPTSPRAHHLLGRAHMATNSCSAAADAFRTAVALHPTFALAHAALAEALERMGRFAHAAEAYRTAHAADPKLADLPVRRAAALLRGGEPDAALAVLETAPESGEGLCLSIVAMEAVGRSGDADAALRDVLARWRSPAALKSLCDALLRWERRGDAARVCARLTDLAPESAAAWNNLGVLHRDLGDSEGATIAFRRALACDPSHTGAHHNLASLHRFTERDEAFGAMEALLAAPGTTPTGRIHLHFALGKALDDLGDVDAAFHHFAEGNRLRRAAHPHSRERLGSLVRALKRAFAGPHAPLAAPEHAPIRTHEPRRLTTRPHPSLDRHARDLPDPSLACALERDAGPLSLAQLGLARGDGSGDAHPLPARPVFLVGLPRSGSTLVEHILASHPDVAGGGERPVLHDAVERALAATGRLDPSETALRTVRALYATAMPRHARVATDKMLSNFQWIGHIALALPEARIIDVRRDPCAMGWSIFRHHFADEGNAFAYDLGDIAHHWRAHRDLMAFWHAHFGERILTVQYDALVADQEGETRRLLDFCGLPFDPACLDFHRSRRVVATASNLQVRRGLYTGSDNAWRTYERHLAPLIEGLATKA